MKVRVALQSREAANMLDLERLYRSHQVPTSYCTSDTTTTCDTGRGCVKYNVRDLRFMVKQGIEQLLCLPGFGLAKKVVIFAVVRSHL